MLDGFKKFILRGNVVDLAVGVLIGAAFNAVVMAFTKDLLTPLVSVIIHQQNLSALQFHLGRVAFAYGDLLNAIISFAITAAVVYFFVVIPLNKLMSRFVTQPPPDPDIVKCPYCLSDIPKAASRCKFCTSIVHQ
jgi:large conductance mechanosensitive channel